MNEHQEKVKALVVRFGLETRPHIRLLDLSSELGELAKEYLKQTDYGKKEFQVSDDWVLELGDIYFSLACLANATGVSLEAALEQSIAEYQTRFSNTDRVSS